MQRPRGVQLEEGVSASELFGRMLREAQAHFDSLRSVEVAPDGATFKRTFDRTLVAFEAARVASGERGAIAKFLADRSQAQLRWADGDGHERPLADVLRERAEPLTLERIEPSHRSRLQPAVPWDGKVRSGADLRELVEDLERKHWMTKAAAEGLRWVLDYAHEHEGTIDLSGSKFVIMGAAAELAPTRTLLDAGAEVLWIDVRSPSEALGSMARLGGTLLYCREGANLLSQPANILATIEAFAASQPVHLGMFAYRPGQGREWRLEGVMNAIARALDPKLVASISFYVSPTSAHVVQPEDARAARERRDNSPRWQRLLRKTGVLQPPLHERDHVAVAKALVPLQGASYQAAQYVSKLMAAEAFASGDGKHPIRVSANVAGITKTESMSQPVFQAGFIGASLFGVRIFEPATTRAMSSLLMLRDVLRPANGVDDPAQLFERQIHGGVFAMSDALDGAIKVAAMAGFARKPSLLGTMMRRG